MRKDQKKKSARMYGIRYILTLPAFGSAPKVTLQADNLPSHIRSKTPVQNGSSKSTVNFPDTLSMTIPP